MEIKWVLASNSPRRRALFSKICPRFAVIPADVNEQIPAGTPPEAAVKLLARRKAEAVLQHLKKEKVEGENSPVVVLGSDTVVAYDGKILGKPKDEKEAFETLKLLSGNTHCVYTGVCFASEGYENTQAACSFVTFRNLTDGEIYEYIATGSPLDKAGAYGIQDGKVVKSFRGDYDYIVGLPSELTEKMYEEVKKYVEGCH